MLSIISTWKMSFIASLAISMREVRGGSSLVFSWNTNALSTAAAYGGG